jgi:hypothetical protein
MDGKGPTGSPGYTRAIVLAQMLAQLGAFALPALLPGYIERWSLSATEAGWLVGIFFAAYVRGKARRNSDEVLSGRALQVGC